MLQEDGHRVRAQPALVQPGKQFLGAAPPCFSEGIGSEVEVGKETLQAGERLCGGPTLPAGFDGCPLCLLQDLVDQLPKPGIETGGFGDVQPSLERIAAGARLVGVSLARRQVELVFEKAGIGAALPHQREASGGAQALVGARRQDLSGGEPAAVWQRRVHQRAPQVGLRFQLGHRMVAAAGRHTELGYRSHVAHRQQESAGAPLALVDARLGRGPHHPAASPSDGGVGEPHLLLEAEAGVVARIG